MHRDVDVWYRPCSHLVQAILCIDALIDPIGQR